MECKEREGERKEGKGSRGEERRGERRREAKKVRRGNDEEVGVLLHALPSKGEMKSG